MDAEHLLLAEVASAHHGMIATHHLELLELSEDQREWLLRTHVLTRSRYGAYRFAAVPPSWKGELLAACWAGGTRAFGSIRSAAAVWDVPGGDQVLQEVTCPRWRRARHETLVVHETKAWEGDVTIVDGIPVTTIERTILDLGAVRSTDVVERALEAALRRELTTWDAMYETVERLGRRGRNGVGVLRKILDERDADRRLTDSDRERMMLQAFRKHGIPDPVPQYVIRHNGLFIARVDAALPQYKLAFEYESFEWHTGKAALIRDTSRRNQLLAIGWPTIGVTAADLRSGGLVVCRQILDVIRRAS